MALLFSKTGGVVPARMGLAACIEGPRDPDSTVHTLADIIRFRLLMITAEDGNDATGLRADPIFKMALERLPSGRDLCSQSTISRLENANAGQ